ncbi:hypothetical protein GE061_005179 [Apolygus lucorum]|uniref:Retrotransposon gag domain-containing protein n=1 Tax=Apolygus lucorum TaxID=248454 RepID=A0A8S9WZG2_APOLU|nr:hypothetical protein GE061_005179 [Apolygus lucorum]
MPDPEEAIKPEKVKFCITFESAPNDSKTSIHCIKWIQTTDENTIYEFPSELQQLTSIHKNLLQIPIIKSVQKSLNKRGNFRIISVTLPAEIVPQYFDADGNCVFQDYYLPEKDYQAWKMETTPPKATCSSATTTDVHNAAILELLQRLTAEPGGSQQVTPVKRLNLSKVKSDFILENFDGKSFEVGRWLDIFHRECERCQVIHSEDKILILRLFMDGSAKNWYASTLVQLGLDTAFPMWETKMREAFKEQGWKKIREAYNYRYLGGNYVDYVLRKQNILLEQEHTVDQTVQLNLIVIGLPLQVQDKLDRSKIKSIEELLGELRKLESTATQFQKLPLSSEQKNKKTHPPTSNEKKKPCSICFKLGHPGRFHPESLCRNRQAAERNERAIRAVNNLEIQETLNESITDQKN